MAKKSNRKIWLFGALLAAAVVGIIFSLNYEESVFENPAAEVGRTQIDSTSLVADAPVSGGSAIGENQAALPDTRPAVAAGAYLMDGRQLAGWKTDKRWPIASITKLLSAYVAETLMDPEQSVVMSQQAVDTAGDSGGFKLGEMFKVSDLVKAMLMVSSNDAAAALAQNYGQASFVEEMNAVAKGVGMSDSHFVEPTGLSVQNQSTVEDLVKLVRHIWRENRGFLETSRRPTDLIVDTNLQVARQLVNINQFAGRDDFLGGKTGMLPEAEGNLVSVFNVPGLGEPVIIVVLGSRDRFGETVDILSGL